MELLMRSGLSALGIIVAFVTVAWGAASARRGWFMQPAPIANDNRLLKPKTA
jgi:hypothetical protein